MVVIVLSASSAALRGSLTRWLLEVAPGVFVGHLSARVRDQVWELVRAYIGEGRALLVYSTRSEQRFAVSSIGHAWEPADVEGCVVMRTPYKAIEGSAVVPGAVKPATEAWSIAGRRRRFRSSTERALGRD